jgi:hypothetical protein
MPWVDSVPAIVHAWYLGNATGDAIADVLFGKVNPSGKLPLTFPTRLEDVPSFGHFSVEDGKVLLLAHIAHSMLTLVQVRYAEDIFIVSGLLNGSISVFATYTLPGIQALSTQKRHPNVCIRVCGFQPVFTFWVFIANGFKDTACPTRHSNIRVWKCQNQA